MIRAQHGDFRGQACPCRRLVRRIELAEPRKPDGFLGRFQIFLHLRLRGGLRLCRRVRAKVAELFVHGFLGLPVRRAGDVQTAGLLEFFDGLDARLAELAGAVAVVIAQLLEVLLQRDHL